MPENKNVAVPEIVISMGDPAGIGPEIIAKALKSLLSSENVVFSVVGDRHVLLSVFTAYCPEALASEPGRVSFVDPGELLEKCVSGYPDEKGATKALRSIEKATSMVMSGEGSRERALVTAPVSKENIARIHPGFVGHTEFLQKTTGADFVTMAFVGKNLRVVPVTRHLALRDVPARLTKEMICRTIGQVVDGRRILSDVHDPVIIVTALNPHGGEGGRIGGEETTVIGPAVERARETYAAIEGPVPSDVAFYRARKIPGSIVVAMYHDQCLGPFKMIDFNTGVNITLGLGIIRTSPDHGTAFDIAGKGSANPDSMIHAVKLAIKAVRVPG
jgi:4-hydroxythreonine-4-phosphate dehydrogenase